MTAVFQNTPLLSSSLELDINAVTTVLDSSCVEAWFPKLGYEIDFTNLRPYSEDKGNEVNFVLYCHYPECDNWVSEVRGDNVRLAISGALEEVKGDQVSFFFECETGGGGSEFVYFNGNIDFVDGEAFDFGFTETLILNFEDGIYWDPKGTCRAPVSDTDPLQVVYNDTPTSNSWFSNEPAGSLSVSVKQNAAPFQVQFLGKHLRADSAFSRSLSFDTKIENRGFTGGGTTAGVGRVYAGLIFGVDEGDITYSSTSADSSPFQNFTDSRCAQVWLVRTLSGSAVSLYGQIGNGPVVKTDWLATSTIQQDGTTWLSSINAEIVGSNLVVNVTIGPSSFTLSIPNTESLPIDLSYAIPAFLLSSATARSTETPAVYTVSNINSSHCGELLSTSPARIWNTLSFQDGEFVEFDFGTISTLGFDFRDGAYIPDGKCGISSDLVNPRIVKSLGTGITTTTITPDLITLKSGQGDSDGTNIVFDPYDTGTIDELSLTFRLRLVGDVYDDDDTDGAFKVGFIGSDTPEDLFVSNSIWRYKDPTNRDAARFNHPLASTWLSLRPSTSSSAIRTTTDSSTIDTYTSFSRQGINAADGTVLVNTVIKKDLINPLIAVYQVWFDDTLMIEYILPWGMPSKMYPFFHFHNYARSGYVEIIEPKINGCEGLLTISPSSNVTLDPVNNYDGASAAAELSTSINFGNINAYDGGSGLFAISTSTTLSANAYDGAAGSITLSETVPATLEIRHFDGASATVGLVTTSRFTLEARDGATFALELAANPAANFDPLFADGAEASFTLSTAANLGTLPSYDGATAVITGMDTVENYLFFSGESVNLGLSTADTFGPRAYVGEDLGAELNIRPSEGIGINRGYSGEFTGVSLTTLPQVLLYPNVISARDEFVYDAVGIRSIDLLNTSCCPVTETYQHVELSGGPEPYQRYDGDKTVFTVDLSTLQRFSLNAYSGEVFDMVETDELFLKLNFFEGSGLIEDSLEFDNYNFHLCEGNFVPDGDNVHVELIAIEPGCSQTDLMFSGEMVSLDVENNIQFGVYHYAGEEARAELFIDPIIRLNFYTGEFTRISNPEFSMNFYNDANAELYFDEPPTVASAGEYAEVSLSTDYDVEFLETGCLDNEFVPMNENGDPDWDKFNPVPVELDFFTHSIKARCF